VLDQYKIKYETRQCRHTHPRSVKNKTSNRLLYTKVLFMDKFIEKCNDELPRKMLTIIECKIIILSAFQNDEVQDIIKKYNFASYFLWAYNVLSLRKNIITNV
jgi:hypothetical protein